MFNRLHRPLAVVGAGLALVGCGSNKTESLSKQQSVNGNGVSAHVKPTSTEAKPVTLGPAATSLSEQNSNEHRVVFQPRPASLVGKWVTSDSGPLAGMPWLGLEFDANGEGQLQDDLGKFKYSTSRTHHISAKLTGPMEAKFECDYRFESERVLWLTQISLTTPGDKGKKPSRKPVRFYRVDNDVDIFGDTQPPPFTGQWKDSKYELTLTKTNLYEFSMAGKGINGSWFIRDDAIGYLYKPPSQTGKTESPGYLTFLCSADGQSVKINERIKFRQYDENGNSIAGSLMPTAGPVKEIATLTRVVDKNR